MARSNKLATCYLMRQATYHKELKMKVRELIERLEDMNPEMEVGFAYPSGDHWRTALLGEIATVEEDKALHSPYHDKDKLADEDEMYSDNPDPTLRDVVVLR